MPFLHACGGGSGGSASSDAFQNAVHDTVPTAIPADDWPTGAPESQGLTSATMLQLMNGAAKVPFLFSLLVVRNGVMVGESYFNGAKSSDMQEVESITKTVSSLLVGTALRDGKLASTSDTLRALLPREIAMVPNSVAGDVTLGDVLTMRSGLAWNETAQQAMLASQTLTLSALGLPSDGTRHGNHWNYSSAVSHLLSPILANAYGMNEEAIATHNLFGPLGIKQSSWVANTAGENFGSFGLHLRTRDLMKIAWMSMQGGQWQGKSVVPAEWLTTSQSNLIGGSLGHEASFSQIGYGNLWWNGTMAGKNVIIAWGFGGQFAILVPELQMAIATASKTANLTMAAARAQEEVVLNLIGAYLAAI